MKHRNKLAHGQEHEQGQEQSAEQRARHEVSREFSTVEDLLRHDLAQTEVPPGIAEKLRAVPNRKNSWWRNLLGGS